jgi:hypothetical protein
MLPACTCTRLPSILRDAIIAPIPKAALKRVALPPAFSERASPAYIDYKLYVVPGSSGDEQVPNGPDHPFIANQPRSLIVLSFPSVHSLFPVYLPPQFPATAMTTLKPDAFEEASRSYVVRTYSNQVLIAPCRSSSSLKRKASVEHWRQKE